MNTGASWPSLIEARARVLEIQAKLHRWAGENEGRQFDDLFNLMCDPALHVVAWNRVRSNKGANTTGIDGESGVPWSSRTLFPSVEGVDGKGLLHVTIG